MYSIYLCLSISIALNGMGSRNTHVDRFNSEPGKIGELTPASRCEIDGSNDDCSVGSIAP